MGCLAENLKFLLWSICRQKHVPMDNYGAFLKSSADSCGIPEERFRKILNEDTEATGAEIQQIKAHFMKYDEERLRFLEYDQLFQGDIESHKNELIIENILYLIKTIPWGDNRDFINALQIQNSTLTRWKSGTMKPSRHFQKEICKYFGIGDPDELKMAYLFFGLSPATTPQRKLECKRLIDVMDREEFERIYPALLKLLK